jgi:hypothetical protein
MADKDGCLERQRDDYGPGERDSHMGQTAHIPPFFLQQEGH